MNEDSRVDEIDPVVSSPPPEDTTWVTSLHTGYIQRVDADALLELARERDITVWLALRVGRLRHRGGAVGLRAR